MIMEGFIVFYDILHYIIFCHETSIVYPFEKQYEDITLSDIYSIEELTDGYTDTETIHEACTEILGTCTS